MIRFIFTLFFFGVVVLAVDDKLVFDDREHQFERVHDFQTASFLIADQSTDN